MANLRYGMKEVANVIFFDVSTNKPVIFFDTLKVSTIENTSESAEARGGQGNNKLMAWDFGRSATLTLQDALLSDISLSILSGNAVSESNVDIVGREVLTAATTTGVTVTCAETPKNVASITVYKVSGGLMTTEVTGFTLGANPSKVITFPTGVTAGEQLMVFYTYTKASGASKVTFSGSAFPATYKVVGDTVVRGEDGVDRKMQFVIPKAKLQSNFSLSMESENVSTFDFVLDVLVESGTNRLYDIIRVN